MWWLRRAMRFLILPGFLLGTGAGSVPYAGAQPDLEAADNAAAATVLLTAQIWQDDSGESSPYRECAMGSGSIISGEGAILTNSHVVDVWRSLENVARAEEAELRARDPSREITLTRRPEISIWMVDGQDRNPNKRYTATVVERDPLETSLRSMDLALLGISGDAFGKRYDRPISGLPHLELGNSDALPSRTVTIFGYPSLDGAHAVNQDTTGEASDVSCTPPPSETIQRIQGSWTGNDQSVNPSKMYVSGDVTFGNSGGSAVDDQGQLIGVPTRVEAFTGGSRVVLVPINRAKPFVEDVVPDLAVDDVPGVPSTTAPDPTVASTTTPAPPAGPTQAPTSEPAGTLVPPAGFGVVEVLAFACAADENGERTEFVTESQGTATVSLPEECVPVDAEFTLDGLDSVGGPGAFRTGDDGQYQVAVPPKAYLLTETSPDLPGTSSQGFMVEEVPGPTRVVVINYVASLPEPTETSTQFPSVAEHNGLGNVLISHEVEDLPNAPMTVRMLRMTLAPGASVPLHFHSGIEFDYVESGTLTVSSTGTMVVNVGYNRYATSEAQTLSEGSWVMFDTGTDMQLANAGTEDVVLLSVVLLSVGSAMETITYTGGTPAAADFDGVSFVVLGDGLVQDFPSGTARITVDRVGADAGEPVSGFDGAAMLSKVSGIMAFTATEGVVQVSRTDEPGLQPSADPGEAFELNDNDAAFFPNGYQAIQREAASDELLLMRLLIQPDGELAGEPALVTTSSR